MIPNRTGGNDDDDDLDRLTKQAWAIYVGSAIAK